MADVSLGTLRTRVATYLNATQLSTAQLNDIINLSIQNLVRLITNTGEKFYVQKLNFSLTAGNDAYALPDNIAKVMGVDVWTDTIGQSRVSMTTINFDDRNMYTGTPNVLYLAIPLQYDVIGDNLTVFPIPQSTNKFTLWYVPIPQPLVSDSDTFNFHLGWDDYVTVDAAILAADTIEIDKPYLNARKAQLEEAIRSEALNRNQGQTHTGTDMTGPKFPFNIWSWYG